MDRRTHVEHRPVERLGAEDLAVSDGHRPEGPHQRGVAPRDGGDRAESAAAGRVGQRRSPSLREHEGGITLEQDRGQQGHAIERELRIILVGQALAYAVTVVGVVRLAMRPHRPPDQLGTAERHLLRAGPVDPVAPQHDVDGIGGRGDFRSAGAHDSPHSGTARRGSRFRTAVPHSSQSGFLATSTNLWPP